MRRADLVSDISNLTNITGQSTLIQRALNRAMDRISGYTRWPFYLDFGYFATADDITAGDADVTNNSKSVSSDNGSTSWPTTIVGRKFRVSENPYYTIAARGSATALTLDQVYQGSTATDNSYRIYKDEYLLNADVDLQHLAKTIQTGFSLGELDNLDFEGSFPTPTATGEAVFLTQIGTRQNLYTTGTVSASAGGTAITGASTAWTGELAQGVSRGSFIRIGNVVYTIRSVDSDTQVTIYGTIGTAVSAGTSYQIFMTNPLVQLYPIPTDIRNIYYRYWRKPYPMENDWDEPDLPSNFHGTLVHAAMAELWIHKGDAEKAQLAESMTQRWLQEMKDHFTSRTKLYQRKSQAHYLNHRGPRWPSNFDVRATAP